MRKLFKDCLYILFLVALLFVFTDQPSFSGTLKFAQLSDIHYSTVREDNGYKLLSKTRPLLKDAVEQINNEQNIDFTVITGDGVDKPTKQSFEELVDELNFLDKPWYFVVGNHDIDPSGYLTKNVLVDYLKKNNSDYSFDLPHYTFKTKSGFRLVFMDGALDDVISPKGKISDEQLNWLDSILSKSKKDVVLIFIHYPLYPPYESKSHEIVNADEFKAVLKKYKMPIAIFSGHYHAAKIIKRGNILNVSSPTLAGYPNSFRIVEVDNRRNKVIFNFKFKETNLKDLQAKTKILTLGGAKYYGKPEDRNTTIVIEKK